MPSSPSGGGLDDSAGHHSRFRDAAVGGEKNEGTMKAVGSPENNPPADPAPAWMRPKRTLARGSAADDENFDGK
jgi:hypothetical protein